MREQESVRELRQEQEQARHRKQKQQQKPGPGVKLFAWDAWKCVPEWWNAAFAELPTESVEAVGIVWLCCSCRNPYNMPLPSSNCSTPARGYLVRMWNSALLKNFLAIPQNIHGNFWPFACSESYLQRLTGWMYDSQLFLPSFSGRAILAVSFNYIEQWIVQNSSKLYFV